MDGAARKSSDLDLKASKMTVQTMVAPATELTCAAPADVDGFLDLSPIPDGGALEVRRHNLEGSTETLPL